MAPTMGTNNGSGTESVCFPLRIHGMVMMNNSIVNAWHTLGPLSSTNVVELGTTTRASSSEELMRFRSWLTTLKVQTLNLHWELSAFFDDGDLGSLPPQLAHLANNALILCVCRKFLLHANAGGVHDPS